MLSQSPDRLMVEETAFKGALRHFASGVTIITTRDETGAARGMTATAFTSLSLRPPLVLVAIGRETRCHAQITANKSFGVNILHDHQAALSRHFGGQVSPTDKAPRFGLFAGVPIIEDAMVRLACDLEAAMEGGDHTIFIGLVKAAVTMPGDPLLHFDGRYRRLAPE